jgi:hypothetical protein
MRNALRPSVPPSLVAIGSALALQATAATLHVCPSGCAYNSIQDAVNAAAASGDVILIGKGRYVGNVTIEGKALTLIGAAGGAAGVTEVSGSGHGPVFTLGLGSGNPLLIELRHLTITGGDHETGTGVGGGVQVRTGAYLHLLDSVLMQNTARFGGGLGVNTPAGPPTTVTGCLIDDDTAVVDNPQTPDGLGGGVYVAQQSSLAVQASQIVRNRALDGGGLFSDTRSQVTIDHSTVSGNEVDQIHFNKAFIGGVGGGVNAQSDLSITYSGISHNSAEGDEGGMGGGLFVLLGGKDVIAHTSITNNIADGNSGAVGTGGGIFAAAANRADPLVLDHVSVVDNEAGQNGVGGIANEGTLVLSHSTIEGNSGTDCSGGVGCPP